MLFMALSESVGRCFFSLTADEFRDSMACRYGKSPKGLQAWCDGCGECFNMNHALNCKNGGLVYQRHNELRDENCDLNKKAGFSQVISEPIVKEAGNNGLGELRGDWVFWSHRGWRCLIPAFLMLTPLPTRPFLLMQPLISTGMKRRNCIQLKLIRGAACLHQS